MVGAFAQIGSAFLLGLFWQQVGWLAHDFLHHQVFRHRWANNWAGLCLGNISQVLSMVAHARSANRHRLLYCTERQLFNGPPRPLLLQPAFSQGGNAKGHAAFLPPQPRTCQMLYVAITVSLLTDADGCHSLSVQGFSVDWWKSKHNTHHAAPNELADDGARVVDPDIDTLPLLVMPSFTPASCKASRLTITRTLACA